MLGHWRLDLQGRRAQVGSREQRVTALLGLRGTQPRAAVAGTLWPDSTDVRARANLRTSLLRLRSLDAGIVDSGRASVALGPQVLVDVWNLLDRLDQLELLETLDGLDLHAALATLAGPDLLPGWYDDWVLYERERLNHRRIRALEKVASRGGWYCLGAFGTQAQRAGIDPKQHGVTKLSELLRATGQFEVETGTPPGRFRPLTLRAVGEA